MENEDNGDNESKRTVSKGEEVDSPIVGGEVAIQRAQEMLAGFDALYNDDEKRKKITITSGITLGSALGDLVLAGESKNEADKIDHFARGSQTLFEILTGVALGAVARTRNKKV